MMESEKRSVSKSLDYGNRYSMYLGAVTTKSTKLKAKSASVYNVLLRMEGKANR